MRLDISSFKRIVVLTGAGISAESGVSTFRDSNGLWEQHRIEDVATPEAFRRDPVLVWRFYSMRRKAAATVSPNLAHDVLARFGESSRNNGVEFTLVTQNVDMLHERACAKFGGPGPVTMHGTLSLSRCTSCGKLFRDLNAWFDANGPVFGDAARVELSTPLPSDRTPKTQDGTPKVAPIPSVYPTEVARDGQGLPLSSCCTQPIRPHIVWFGEMPLEMYKIERALNGGDLFVTIGTSGQVYPAAGFLSQAKIAGAVTACLNKEPLPQQRMVDFYFEGPATQTVADLFKG